MSKFNINDDLLMVEQSMWFVQSDLKQIIEKSEANRESKNKIEMYKKIHHQAVILVQAIESLNND